MLWCIAKSVRPSLTNKSSNQWNCYRVKECKTKMKHWAKHMQPTSPYKHSLIHVNQCKNNCKSMLSALALLLTGFCYAWLWLIFLLLLQSIHRQLCMKRQAEFTAVNFDIMACSSYGKSPHQLCCTKSINNKYASLLTCRVFPICFHSKKINKLKWV